ncbi:MAG: OmpA family protein [Planctomycetota bacterium]
MTAERIVIREVEDGVDGAPAWITTFVDMVSLLVTFFILLYTFSSVRAFDTFAYPKNIISTSGVFPGESSDTIKAPRDDLMLAVDLERGSRKRHTRPVNELRENLAEMGQRLSNEHLPVDLRGVDDGLRVAFTVQCGFRPGQALVNSSLERSLVELGETVRPYPLMVVVEGHTDAGFLPSPSFPDAESLSIARARAAAEVLVEAGRFDSSLVLLEAHGAGRPRDPRASTARERARNRRVEIRLVPMSRDRLAAEGWRRDR